MPDYAARLARLTSEPSRDEPAHPARMARVARTRTEMMAQGPAIEATLEGSGSALARLAERAARRSVSRLVVAGCGDSWFVGLAARAAIEDVTGLAVEPVQALEYAAARAPHADARTLVLGLSASGTTSAVLEALACARERGALTAAVSNVASGPLQEAADAALLVRATRSGWPTQSSTAAVALLVALGVEFARAGLGGREGAADEVARALADLGPLADDAMSALDPAAEAAARALGDAPLVLLAGLGPDLAAASFGAAKIRELSTSHAFAMPLEEMHHYRLPKRGDALVIIATHAAAAERALDTALVAEAIGARTIAILGAREGSTDAAIAERAAVTLRAPSVHPALQAVAATLPLHLLAYHFAVAQAGAAATPPRADRPEGLPADVA